MKVAKLFENGRSQAVRLPKEYRFDGNEVNIAKVGEIVMLIPNKNNYQSFIEAIDMFSDDFMEDGRGNLNNQKRDNI